MILTEMRLVIAVTTFALCGVGECWYLPLLHLSGQTTPLPRSRLIANREMSSFPGAISFADLRTQVLDVHVGDSVTLTCSNLLSGYNPICWFRIDQTVKMVDIFHCFLEPAKSGHAFSKPKYETSSNLTTFALKINHVNSSDSGFYFCGSETGKSVVINDSAYLNVQSKTVVKSWHAWCKRIQFCLSLNTEP